MGSSEKNRQDPPAPSPSTGQQPATSASSPPALSPILEPDRIQAIIEAIGDPVSIQDTSFRVLYQNKAHRDFVGNHIGELCYEAYTKNEKVCEGCPLAVTFRDGQVHTAEKDGAAARGITRVEITASPLKDESGKIIAGIEVVRDLTQRRKAEEDLRNAEQKFRNLVERSLFGIFIYQDGFFPYVNPKGAELLGYAQDEISRVPLTAIISEEDLGIVQEHLSDLLSGRVTTTHSVLRARKKDGTFFEIESQGSRTDYNGSPAIMGTFLDITERRKMEAENLHYQKFESLGAFASNIALEYNNILTAIIGNLALAKMYAKPGYEVYDVLLEAEKASLRAKDLTAQLLSFSEGTAPVKKTLYLQELLTDIISISADPRLASSRISSSPALWPIEADESQLGQAIHTLLLSAQEVSPAGASLEVSIENVQMSPSSPLPLAQGDYVMLTIQDQGGSISDEELRTMFDPFHATEGKGRGLGLASAYAVVRKHGGLLTANANRNIGTMYRIYLPAVREVVPAASTPKATSQMRRGRVLVMDDEEIVRAVVSRLLQQCGYESETSRDGTEMLRLYRENREAGKKFDLVILDLIIQEGMGGQEAIKHLLAYDPSAKVIVSSGYSHNPLMTNFREFGFTGFLPKPYKLDELKRVLTEVSRS